MMRKVLQVLLFCGVSVGWRLEAAELSPASGVPGTLFGTGASMDGGILVFGATGSSLAIGEAYLYRGLDPETGEATEAAKLVASDGAQDDLFSGPGRNSVSGTMALIGALRGTVGSNVNQGAGYLYRNLDTASGTVTETAKLAASDGVNNDQFGTSVGLVGNTGIVGASNKRAAYVFRNLDTATGTVTENAKLIASDDAANSQFGGSVAISGSIGVVGAYWASINGNSQQGAAYIYRDLNTVTGTVTENAKLVASDGGAGDRFGNAMSISGNMVVVTAPRTTVGANTRQGAVYLYRNLDTATGTVTQNAKLSSSDGVASGNFGDSVAIDGTVALVGSLSTKIGANSAQGAVYLFRNLDTASGSVTENVKIFASSGTADMNFGSSVAMSGDQFAIGARGVDSKTGAAFTGSVSSMTTMDFGNTQRTIEGISFITQDDWTIGGKTSGNIVVLSAGDAAQVVDGRSLYIGESAGSNNNALALSGSLTAEEVNIGSMAGNSGNALVLNSGSLLTVDTIRLAGGNSIVIEGDYADLGAFLTYLGGVTLNVWDGASWQTADGSNAASLLTASIEADYTRITAVPEPGSAALFGVGLAAAAVALRRRFVV